jgi:phage shock protein E
MFGFLFGKNKVREALRNGAVVIDVRTPHEYDSGKVPGSVNIPIDRISANIERIKAMKQPVVFCCASGIRAASARIILQSAGLKEVYNGGSWESVLKKINTL